MITIQNKGMMEINSLEEYTKSSNACLIDINKGIRGGIRVRADSVSLEVDIRNANGDVEY